MGDLRAANRHNYTMEEIAARVQRPSVHQLLEVLRFRNQFPAFDGSLTIDEERDGVLVLTWTDETSEASLRADFTTTSFSISTRRGSGPTTLVFSS